MAKLKKPGIEEQAEVMARMIHHATPTEGTRMMLNLLRNYDILRREANAAWQLIKGSEICVKAYNSMTDANFVNLSWGPEGTPEGVAKEYLAALDAIASGKSKPLTEEELSKL